ncbi:histone-lysine N-methyltransferase SETDB1-B-like [Thalassophryne amazonica]|uniref:histone-lysine N-methyltransferase SETDB1-B-like n=1 Tax=Thalassophryne amazonica TaxID=390379 RepID=UPI001471E0E0|nr:histone-lysine N-methyltransferase SETDB1-B-like [Thalassophryne amazonica]
MEEDEQEFTKEQLQMWIREKVKNNWMVSPIMLKKYNVLQSLLGRREKKAADFMKLCQSVADCEAAVRNLYSLLGWHFRETDSDEDYDTVTGCGDEAQED